MKPRLPIMVKPQSEVQSAINVTPLVDVVLVLLIIFMVVMPLLDKDLQVRIPEDEQVERPEELPPEQIIVHVLADGSLQLNGTPIAENTYVSALQSHLSARARSACGVRGRRWRCAIQAFDRSIRRRSPRRRRNLGDDARRRAAISG